MKRLLFLIAFLGTMGSLWAQTVENLFEWQGENGIVAKPKFLGLSRNQELPNMPLYTYMEYDVHSDNGDSYCIKMRGVGNKEMSKGGDYDFFEIHHNGKMILRYNPFGILYDNRYMTVNASKDNFIKVPLSNGSFALFFGGWFFGGCEAPEMIVVVVSCDKAKVVFDDNAYAYKYTPGEHFSMEYVDDVEGLYDSYTVEFTESFLKSRMKYKIWREGNMLKYKSWK